MPDIFEKLRPWLLQFIPRQCQVCFQDSDVNFEICSYCWEDLPWLKDRCLRCGLRLDAPNEGQHCLKCQEHAPYFDRYLGILEYNGASKAWLSALKFSSKLGYARILGKIWAEGLRKVADYYRQTGDWIVPIPLHFRRWLSRGFNQSLELIKPSVQAYGFDLKSDFLIKTKHTQAQSSLSQRAERLDNIQEGSFAIHKKYLNSRMPERLILVDDVMTTGKTVNACAKMLKEANLGIEYIEIWTLFRA
ncbi:MAG: ComF family protein [Gammaproteobacteria bacterium]